MRELKTKTNYISICLLALFLASCSHVPSKEKSVSILKKNTTVQKKDAKNPLKLSILDTPNYYILVVPAGRVVMSLPREGLSKGTGHVGGATSSPRYFYFNDYEKGLIISGWFEPASKFAGLKRFWKGEKDAWKLRGLPDPSGVEINKYRDWDTISYNSPNSVFTPLTPLQKNTHIRAHYVKAGTWIDLHISLTSAKSEVELKKEAFELLASIKMGQINHDRSDYKVTK